MPPTSHHIGTRKDRPRSAPTAHGFTLLELLVVIAIVAIVAALLFGGAKTFQEKAKRIKCVGNLKAIGTGILQNTADLQGKWPAVYDGKPWYTVLNQSYGVTTNTFFCPSARNPAFTADRISYGYNITLGGGAVSAPPKYPLSVTRKLSELIIVADSIDTGSQQYYLVNGDPPRMGTRHEGKANIFWGDGHLTAESRAALTNVKYWKPDYVEP